MNTAVRGQPASNGSVAGGPQPALDGGSRLHLDRLEKAGIVTGHLELSEDGKAMKYFELAPFELRLNADVITEALRASDHSARTAPETDEQQDGQRKESDL